MDSTTTASGQTYLLVASQKGGGLTLFSVAANGRLTVQESFGFTGRLQVDLPSVLQKAGIRTDRFAVIGYYATASLIVLACQKAEI